MKKEKFIHALENASHLNLIGPIHSSIVPNKIKKAPLLFVDGGLDFKNQLSSKLLDVPTLSIGDGDSSSPVLELDLTYPRDKDQTDLQLAMEMLPQGLKVEAWGFSGERLDHYLANIGEFQKHSLLKKSLCVLDDQILFLPPGQFHLNYEGTFSLLSSRSTEIKLNGELKYPLEELFSVEPLSGRTVSNEAFGDFLVESTQGIMIIPVDKSCSDLKLR
ncbi:MAG: hypothetical protein EP326_13655 [Deltaproteobacteria bacterium]|nr:MAG: hypothetical protein EP326_13655 [Deltaproteobacteria bacterium]